ncbi:hypothetical protein FJZ20_02815 [Candidatus Pacearchaeota archaeon]|nr:hypothetical protein [Candidatus Pacearchaeota archaeon]
MNFITKIFQGKSDSLVHIQFQKFGRGEFKNKALIIAKRIKNIISISTTADFANELVYFCAKKLGKNRTNVTGAIVSTSDLKNFLEIKDIKQFQGVKRYIIDKEMSGDEILLLLEKFPKAFFALSFNVPGNSLSLKIKPKAPKSAKPSTKEDKKLPADFCKITTEDNNLAEDFVFEKPFFKKAEISHTYLIKEIEIPESLKKSDDFLKIREESKRKGEIIRIAEIDGEKIEKRINFSA